MSFAALFLAAAPLWAQSPVEFIDDPRVALLSVVQVFAATAPAVLPPGGAEALAELTRPLQACRSHEAVSIYARRVGDSQIDAAAGNLLRYGFTPVKLGGTVFYDSRLPGEDWNAFVSALARFQSECGFMEAFNASKDSRKPFLEAARKELDSDVSAEALLRYAGAHAPYKMLLYPAPFLFSKEPMFSSVRNAARGTFEQVRAFDESAGYRLSQFGNAVSHELGHLIVPILSAEAWSELRAYPLAPACGFSTDYWRDCFEEHLVYALTARARALNGLGEAEIEEEYDGMPALFDALKKQEKGKRLKKPLAQLLDRLASSMKKGRAPLPESANAVFWIDEAERQAAMQRRSRAEALLKRAAGRKPSEKDLARIAELRRRLPFVRDATPE